MSSADLTLTNEALGTRVLRAAGWGYLGTAVRLVMQLAVQIVLARLLGPVEYGVFAIGVIILSLAQFFGDVASSALIPRPTLDEREIRFSITWQMIVCSALTCALILLADPLAMLFAQPASAPVIVELAFVCILGGIGGVSLALLRRRLDFKSIQLAQIAGYIAGYVLVALPYAIFIEAKVQALVYGWLVQTAVTSIIYFRAAPHNMRPAFRCASAIELLSFSWNALWANLGNWAQSNLDRVVIARFTSPLLTGVYVSSANLLSTPLSQINTTLQQVAFSALAQMESEQDKSRAFVGLLAVATVVYGLAYAFSGAAAGNLVSVLWGHAWLEAVSFIEAFSLAFFAIAIAGVISPILWANRSVGKDSRIQVIASVAIAGGMLVAIQASVLAAVWYVAVVHCLRAGALVCSGARIFGLSVKPFAILTGKVVLFAGVEAVLVSLIDEATAFASAGSLARLLLQLLFFLGFMLAALRFRCFFGRDYEQTINRLAVRMPLSMRRVIGA